MKERVACLGEPQELIQETYDNLADSANIQHRKFETRTRKLEVLLHQESLKLGRVRYLNNNTKLRENIYEQVLYDVKYAVACVLKVITFIILSVKDKFTNVHPMETSIDVRLTFDFFITII